ncbi:MAG TPA: glycosyltransferase family 4 protein [Hyphomonas sp.]|nr:glycosyltransferase family 4 protein [Hyphomonas sp.]HRK66016.1 glycosyltransferase family 4 protein [Hyphomonas sp.]
MTPDIKPRLIFANRFYAPDHSATAQMLTDVAEGLAAKDWDVTILTSRLSYDDPAASYVPEEDREGVRVLRVATTGFGRSNLIGRAFDYLSFYASSFFRLLRIARKGDIVIIKTDPPLLSVPLGFAARLKGAKRVNWLQDIFPETAAELGLTIARGPVGKLLAGIRNHSLRRADLNVVIGPRMGERVKGFGVDPARIMEIQNFCDDEAIRPIAREDNPLRAAWGYTDKDFVVGYSGNLGRAHDLGTFLGAAELLKDQPDIKFLFIGGGHLRRQLEEEAARRNLTSIHTRPYQPREQLALSLSVPDIHWVSLQPRLEGLILPSKLYGIAAAGRPLLMIGDPDGDIGRWVEEFQFGKVVNIGDTETLAASILSLSSDARLLLQAGRNARSFLGDRRGRIQIIGLWQSAFSRTA